MEVTFNNHLSRLIVITIHLIIEYLLNLSIRIGHWTYGLLKYSNELKIIDFKFVFNFSTLIAPYEHKRSILFLDHDRVTRRRHNIYIHIRSNDQVFSLNILYIIFKN